MAGPVGQEQEQDKVLQCPVSGLSPSHHQAPLLAASLASSLALLSLTLLTCCSLALRRRAGPPPAPRCYSCSCYIFFPLFPAS